MEKFYVKHDKSGDILGKEGKWVRKPSEEDAMSWDTEADATSAKPANTECHVLKINRPDPRPERTK